MPYITVGKENEANIDIHYKDWGSGQPIVFSHGWPLSGDDWDAQMMFFANHGYRVIAHDRRGHGRSTQAEIEHSEIAQHHLGQGQNSKPLDAVPSNDDRHGHQGHYERRKRRKQIQSGVPRHRTLRSALRLTAFTHGVEAKVTAANVVAVRSEK